MIDVQDKPARLAPQQRNTGSVPAILPRLQVPGIMRPAHYSALFNEICSVVLVVVLPSVFWCAVISAGRSLLGLETGAAVLSCVGLVIAGFLMVVRASLTIDRSV
jgi:hypothetical protein